MRPTWIAVPLLAGIIALPAEAQVSARLHVDIPIGRPGPVVYGAPRRPLAIREYDPNRFGAWENYYDEWAPETVYYYDGSYYDYPIVEYAEPILVYRYRNEFFFAPRQREFNFWREQYRYRDYQRDYGRNYRPTGRDGRTSRPFAPPQRSGSDSRQFDGSRNYGGQVQPRDGRNDGGQYQAPRSGGQVQPPRSGRDGGQVQPPRNGRDGGQVQGQPRDGRQAQPAPQQGSRGGDRGGRDVGRGRPRGGR